MAAPSGTVWGSIVNGSSSGRKGRIGIYTSVTSTNTKTTVNVEFWFWTIYSCSDGSNKFYYDIGTDITSAATNRGNVSISHTVATGSGWSTSNQTKLGTWSKEYDRSTSAKTYKIYAKFTGIDMIPSGTMYVNASFTVPKLASYTVTYNANGGSGAPSSQTKWYGMTLTLSSTKPTRTGYAFQGWALSKADADAGTWYYAAGGTCGKNENLTLYAVWKANTYAVTYNANGGSGAPSAQTKTYGVALTLSTTKPKRTNYNFLGWGTSASATTVSYAAGASYTKNAKITLYAIWQLAYTKPRITNYTVTRCDENGVESDSGTYALVKFNWACDQTLSSIAIECISGTNETTSTTVSASGTSGNVSKIIGGELSTESTYTVRVVVTDTNGNNRVSRTLPGTKFVIDFLSGGNGVSFGKPAEMDGYVDFGWNAHFTNNLKICGRDLEGNIKEAFQPVNSSGNTVIGWSNYNTRSGNTNIYGHDINFAVSSSRDSNPSSPEYIKPYIRKGESLKFTIRTSGYVTNAGKDVYFLVPFAVPIIGSPTVTITSGQGLMLRQDNKYTHGSAAKTYVTPNSYAGTVSKYCGVRVVASFTDVTNVVNNAPIGIEWDGTITFT